MKETNRGQQSGFGIRLLLYTTVLFLVRTLHFKILTLCCSLYCVIPISKYPYRFQDPLPRVPCEPYDVAAVADAVRAMNNGNQTLDIPPTLRMGFHDACDYNKWAATGGADGRFVNDPESWYAQSRTVNGKFVYLWTILYMCFAYEIKNHSHTNTSDWKLLQIHPNPHTHTHI